VNTVVMKKSRQRERTSSLSSPRLCFTSSQAFLRWSGVEIYEERK
jgi:hypothetical protein